MSKDASPVSGDSVKKLLSCFDSKQAPAQIGKPVFQNDLEYLKHIGVGTGTKSLVNWLGKKVDDNDEMTPAVPIVNFGKKSSTGFMPDDVRMRLFYFKKCISNMEVQAQYKSKSRYPSVAALKATPAYRDYVAPMCKAFNVTDFDEWIDQVQARFFFEEFEIPHILMDQLDTLPMDSSLVRVPGALGRLEGLLETDDAIFTAQSNTQSSYIVESKNCVVHSKITQDLLDDSSPAIIDKLRFEVLQGIARAYERAMLDGDSSGTHIDDDTQAGSAKLYTKAFNGFRKRVFDADAALGAGPLIYDNSGDSLSKDTFAELLKRLKCQGVEKTDLMYVLGCTGSADLVTGAIPELFTAFNFGGLASNVTGQVPPVFGIDVVESEKVREDLEADGKADNPTVSTLTYMLLIQKSRYANWVRQAPRVWAAPSLPSSDEMLMSSKARMAMAGIPMAAGNPERNAAMAINIKTV